MNRRMCTGGRRRHCGVSQRLDGATPAAVLLLLLALCTIPTIAHADGTAPGEDDGPRVRSGGGAPATTRDAPAAVQGPPACESPDRGVLGRWRDELLAQLRVAEKQGDAAAEAAALTALGIVCEQLGEYSLGLTYLTRAQTLLPALDDPDVSAAATGALGVMLYRMGELRAALRLLERARQLHDELGNERGQAAVLANIGLVHLARQAAGQARACFASALAMQERLGHIDALPATLCGLADALAAEGSYAEALERLERGEQLARRLERDRDVARALAGQAHVNLLLGRYAPALMAYQQAVSLLEQQKETPALARTLLDLAVAEEELGLLDAAERHFMRARTLCDALGDRGGAADALRRTARVQVRRGRTEEAARSLEAARLRYERIDHAPGRLWTDMEEAALHLAMGRVERARDLCARALREAPDVRDDAVLAACLGNLGMVHLSAGETEEAVARHEESLAVAQACGSRRAELLARWGLALARWADGDARLCLQQVQEAVHDLDPMFHGLDDLCCAEGRERWAALFDLGVRACIALDDAESAYDLLEWGRARAFVESMGGRRAVAAVVLPDALRREERTALEALRRADQDLRRAQRRGKLREIRDANRALDTCRAELEALRMRMQRSARAGALDYLAPASSQRVRARLAHDEALVLYVLTGAEAAAVVVTHDALRLVVLGESADLRTDAVLAQPWQAGRGEAGATARLARRLIGALELPSSVRRLLVSPHDALSSVPFVLVARGHDLVQVSSASAWLASRCAPATTGQGVLALGDPAAPAGRSLRDRSGRVLPELPAARAEAKAVGDKVLLGLDATRAKLLEWAASRPRWRAVHLACHALLDEQHPLRSALVLAPTGGEPSAWSALDVLGCRLPADLVVLSGCETGRGRVYRAEGVLGLVRAFRHAGAHQVLASLWKVDDDATAALMQRFHVLCAEQGRRPAAALREAQAWVASQPRWRDPYYWAAWVLWGDAPEGVPSAD